MEANTIHKLKRNSKSSRFLEDDMQITVASYLDSIGVLWFHPANERKSSIQAGVRLKKKGVKSGVPDVMILEPKKGFNGLAIELKTERSNGFKKNGKPKATIKGKVSENQAYWLKSLKDKGWITGVCYSVDEAIKQIDFYLK